ncbi:MAG: S24 family peptidase [Thiocapsa sp.]|jgi:phage repressor protein C with HTH and peptisase S24 domain|nr:S24 family peptidase [Thiocapsa sp.]MCG6897284.1 S24 family peptidase [Thiocapsa sp.]MCG6986244.1 S24 family peptidase [Thiocapsa sp.]
MADPTMDSTGCSMHEPYALQVLGDQMEPEFPDRCIVIIEPTDVRKNNSFVFAEVEGVRWFRKFVRESNGAERLIALNRIYPDIELNGLDWHVLGVIIQRNIRRQIKHYDYSAEPETSPTVPITDLTGR